MNYVEWLRVRGCLKWTAIILVAFVGLLLFSRFTYLDISPDKAGFSAAFNGDQSYAELVRTAKQTRTKLPDGTTRTVIDNPRKGVRITIDDHGYWGKHVEIFQKTPPDGVHNKTIDVADIHAQRIMLPDGSLVKIDEGGLVPEDLDYYFLIATLTAVIVATILGAPFARENEGHLELSFTKPVSRIALSLRTILTDVAGIAAAFVMTVLFLMVGHAIFEAPNYTFGPTDTVVLSVGLLSAIGWYALLNAATASMKRGYGGMLGVAWPVAWGLTGIAHAPIGHSPLADGIRAVGSALLWLFPTSYLHLSVINAGSEMHRTSGITSSSPQTDLVILACLALVYGALAVYQWQRVEA